jgi:hypothetical protein
MDVFKIHSACDGQIAGDDASSLSQAGEEGSGTMQGTGRGRAGRQISVKKSKNGQH